MGQPAWFTKGRLCLINLEAFYNRGTTSANNEGATDVIVQMYTCTDLGFCEASSAITPPSLNWREMDPVGVLLGG